MTIRCSHLFIETQAFTLVFSLLLLKTINFIKCNFTFDLLLYLMTSSDVINKFKHIILMLDRNKVF